jgi:hypothetical protein
MGGNTLSATIGVISRVEHHSYAHSGEAFLSIQVDAAVNPGNSGGPALADGKIVGVVMQVISRSQNIGYLVPVSMVKHFIQDMKDSHYDGFADLGVATQKLENPAIRRYYGLDKNISGKLITKLSPALKASGVLKKGDILTAVNGHNIEDDGTVEFREYEYTHYQYFIDSHQMGEQVTLSIIRQGKALKVQVTLKETADNIYMVPTTRYDKMPSYFVYGAYVFSPLSRNLIISSKRNRLGLSHLSTLWQNSHKKEAVVLLKVLASSMSRGDNNFGMWAVDKINGQSFKDFKDFHYKMQHIKADFIILEDKEGVRVIIDKKEALDKQQDILQKYNIEFAKSLDLRK